MTALALNTAALVVEVGAGIPAKSLSLVMDGVHNVSDEVALGFLVLAYTLRVGLSGRFLRFANLFNSLGLLVDPLVALAIAAAIIVPTLRTIAGFHSDLVWPENVACGHAATGHRPV